MTTFKYYYVMETSYGFCVYCNNKPVEGTERLTREEAEDEMYHLMFKQN